MPAPKYPASTGSKPTKTQASSEQNFIVAAVGEGPGDDVALCIDKSAVTEAEVFERLGVEGLNTSIHVRPGACLLGEEKQAKKIMPVGTMTGTLVAMDLPYAIVSITGFDGDKAESFRICVDDLAPIHTVTGSQPTKEPALVLATEATLVLPDFDFDPTGGSCHAQHGTVRLKLVVYRVP